MASNATSSERTSGVVARTRRHGESAAVAVASALAPLAATMHDAAGSAGGRIEARALHRYRVAMRRSRSLLGAFKALFDKPARRRFRTDFAWLNSGTGRLRDLDVLLDDLDQAARDGDVPAQVHVFVRARRDEEHWCVLRLFNSPRYASMMREWSQALHGLALAGEQTDYSMAAAVDHALERQFERVTRHIAHWHSKPRYGALHRVRKDLKHLRYLIEAFTDLFPERELARIQHDLRDLQDLLGEVCDRHAQRELVQAWLASPLVTADPTLYAALTSFVTSLHPAALDATARALAERLQRFRTVKNRARYARLRQAAMA